MLDFYVFYELYNKQCRFVIDAIFENQKKPSDSLPDSEIETETSYPAITLMTSQLTRQAFYFFTYSDI